MALLLAISIPAQAGSVLDFKSSAADVIKNRASLTKFKPSMKPKGGGSVIPLHRINKLNPYAAAAALAGAAASVYWEDELAATPYEIFLGDEEPVVEGSTGGIPDGFESGYFWVNNASPNDHRATAELACVGPSTPSSTYAYEGGVCKVYGFTGGYMGTASLGKHPCAGNVTTASWCLTGIPPSTPIVWPEDGLSMAKVENDTMKFWDAETNTFSLSDPMFYATPEGVGSVEIHAGNVAKIHEWLEVNDAAGNTQTIHEYVTIDANTGAVIGTAQETINAPIDEAIAGDETPTVNVTFPDIMNVKVNEDGVNAPPSDGSSNYDGTGWDLLGNSIGTLPTLPDLNPMPDLPDSGGSCVTVDLGYKGYPLDFPSSSQCTKLHEMRDLLEWMFYMLTAFYLIQLAFKTTEA